MDSRFGFLRRRLNGRSRDDVKAMPPTSRERAALGDALAFLGYGDHLVEAPADELVRVLGNVQADKLPKIMRMMGRAMAFYGEWEREYLKLPLTGGRGEDLLKSTSDDLARLRAVVEAMERHFNPWPGSHGVDLFKSAFKDLDKLQADITTIGRWRASLAESADCEDLAAAGEDLAQAEGSGCPDKFPPLVAGFYDAVAALDVAFSGMSIAWFGREAANDNYRSALEVASATSWDEANRDKRKALLDAAKAEFITAVDNYDAARDKYEAARDALPGWPLEVLD
ncbi:MAG: hypothetical protein LBP92_05895 [Deltaproteobacteria bacterium]|jgi:hypothetical protein|nr:hypothetical protein [Deltaproteobacteria bacterium]